MQESINANSQAQREVNGYLDRVDVRFLKSFQKIVVTNFLIIK